MIVVVNREPAAGRSLTAGFGPSGPKPAAQNPAAGGRLIAAPMNG